MNNNLHNPAPTTGTFALVAVKAARYLGGSMKDEAPAAFALWSVGKYGVNALDEAEFGNRIRTWLHLIKDAGMYDEYQI